MDSSLFSSVPTCVRQAVYSSSTCCASARSLTCCAWSGSFQPHSEEDSSSSKHCAWKSVIPELGCSCSVQSSVGHLVVGMVVDSAVARVVHFCASLRMPCRWSLPRRSVPPTAFCTSRQALPCSASRDRALVCSGSSCFRFGRRAAVPPKHCSRVRTTLVPAAVAAAYGCVPRGQRAPLDADMLELIDRSACLVKPVLVVSSARASRTEHVQRRVGSLLASVTIARSCGRSCAPNPELLLSLLSQRGNYSCSLTVLCTLSPGCIGSSD